MATCTECGQPFEPKASWMRKCWNCWRADRDAEMKEAAFQKGFAAGLDAGRKQAPPANGSAQELVEHLPRLLQLCHPDRHGGSETANKVTQFLLALRKRYRNETTH